MRDCDDAWDEHDIVSEMHGLCFDLTDMAIIREIELGVLYVIAIFISFNVFMYIMLMFYTLVIYDLKIDIIYD